ncbi:MAG TPA: YciI family protein [Diaminobutyricibacter sp.]|uniref:YciI family protein n=1 Tax=Leifsonia sp. McL0618 TaxID=3415677 RepID=UPI003377FA05
MKYMMILNSDEQIESSATPNEEDLNAMGRYNEELIKAGVLLAGEGLHPSSEGARIEYSGDERTVIDGPFTETKELIAGFWIIQAANKAEALEWARRIPLTSGRVEVRQVFDLSEFPQDNEYVQKEAQWREELGESRTA